MSNSCSIKRVANGYVVTEYQAIRTQEYIFFTLEEALKRVGMLCGSVDFPVGSRVVIKKPNEENR